MTLHWLKPDAYHIASQCGRFTVARLTVTPHVWYVAHRKPFDGPSTEIGATRLPATATEDERKAAIAEMQKLCETDSKVGGGSP